MAVAFAQKTNFAKTIGYDNPALHVKICTIMYVKYTAHT